MYLCPGQRYTARFKSNLTNLILMRKLKNEELDRLSLDAFKQSEKIPVIIILDNVRSLNNVGSAFRTADAFRLEKIYLLGITGKPPHREINKTALGATDTVDWDYMENGQDLLSELKQQHYRIVSVEQVEKATLLQDFRPATGEKYALIFGNEVFGVGQELVDHSDICLEIPQYGTKHSLNIAVSIGIVIWDLYSKLSFYPE